VVGGQRHALADLPPGKTRHQLYWRVGGRAAGQLWTGAENLTSAVIRSPDRSQSLYRLSYRGHLYVGTPEYQNIKFLASFWTNKGRYGDYTPQTSVRNLTANKELYFK
jgi:hypothetical protein